MDDSDVPVVWGAGNCGKHYPCTPFGDYYLIFLLRCRSKLQDICGT